MTWCKCVWWILWGNDKCMQIYSNFCLVQFPRVFKVVSDYLRQLQSSMLRCSEQALLLNWLADQPLFTLGKSWPLIAIQSDFCKQCFTANCSDLIKIVVKPASKHSLVLPDIFCGSLPFTFEEVHYFMKVANRLLLVCKHCTVPWQCVIKVSYSDPQLSCIPPVKLHT